jgi:hypothetical protein
MGLEGSFLKKSQLPVPKGWAFLIEDEAVPLLPNQPGPQHKEFHEGVSPLLSGLLHHRMKTQIQVPVYAKVSPALSTEWTGEELMKCGFFHIYHAERAAVIIPF